MDFCFYPKHEYGCPEISHCPHLGGAALGTLVNAASDQGQYLDMLHGQLDFERSRAARLLAEVEELKQEVVQLRLELKVERQRRFACGRDDSETAEAGTTAADDPTAAADEEKTPGKRGAPVGHPGWFRPTPTKYDRLVIVEAPAKCACGGDVTCPANHGPHDHWQEDVVDNVYQTVLYRHLAGRCCLCRRWVQQAGEGELLGSRIGPRLRSLAMYLRNDIGISYRKVPQAIEELFGISFTPASLIAFEKLLAKQAETLVDDIASKIASSEGAVHADETYWTVDGERAYYWLHTTTEYVHFQFDPSRKGQVSRDVLGAYFEGTLVTDCYAGYEAHSAKAKQKCLSHLARTARDWQQVTPKESPEYAFFEDVKQWVKRGCAFHRQRARNELSPAALAAEEAWLRAELSRLENCPLTRQKALTLQARIQKHHDEWLVFVDDPRVPPTNNLAERRLRPLVVLRKITFGHRSPAGARRMAKIMTVKETAKLHGHKPSEFIYYLQMHSAPQSLRHLYSGP